MATPTADRVRRRREVLRASGLRPVQIWVPDTRKPGFAEECRRQAAIVSASDHGDRELLDFLDTALEDELASDE